MKKMVPPSTHSSGRASLLHGVFFWLALAGLLALAFLYLAQALPGPARLARHHGAPAPRMRWLLTSDGERRGFVLRSDLAYDGAAWQLWANGAGQPPLAAIEELCPANRLGHEGLGCNGGYWDTTEHPVGICAGERGIHGARSHPNGFAIAAGRAWIGPLSAHAQLIALPENRPSSPTLETPLNPRPIPRRAPCLIDLPAYPWPVQLDAPTQVVWLDHLTTAPLRFNTRVPLRVRYVGIQPAGSVTPPPAGCLLWIIPTLKSGPPATLAPKPGDRWDLNLSLEPVRGVVQLATCAGPRLIKNGKILKNLYEHTNGNDERTWRTAVGCDRSGGTLWLILLARGLDGEPGVTLRETAQALLELGTSEALNLDGGSSTCAWSSQLGPELLSLFPLHSEIHHALFLNKHFEF